MSYWIYISSLLLFGLSMCFTPGPNNAVAMATGMDKGFRAAVPFCLGAGLGANVTLLLLGLGLKELFERFPVIYDFLRYGGAVYLLWLAWRISGLGLPLLKGSKNRAGPGQGGKTPPQGVSDSEPEKKSGMRPIGFFGAVLFQLLNVKVWLTNVMIVSYYIGAGPDMWLRFAIALCMFTVMGTGAMMSWAAGGALMGRFLTSGGMRRANYLFAAFLVLSIVLLFVMDEG